MTPHDFTRENLDAYLAGGLTLAERRDVEQHTADCAECAQALAEARKLEQTMADLFTEVRPDAALEDRALAKLRKSRLRRASILRFVAAAAAVLVLGIVGAAVQAIAIGLPYSDDLRMSASGEARDHDKGSDRTVDTVARNHLMHGTTQHAQNLKVVDNSESMSGEKLKGKKSKFSVTDGDPAAVEFDTDIQFNNKRIEEVSVPGYYDPQGAAGIVNGTSLSSAGGKPGDPGGFKKEEGWGYSFDGRDLSRLATTHYAPVTLGFGTGTMAGYAKEGPTAKYYELGDSREKKSDDYYRGSAVNNADPKKTPPAVGTPPKDGPSEFPAGGSKRAGAESPPAVKKPEPGVPPEKFDPMPDDGRKIVRTGDMEFEVVSFDAAADGIGKLIATPKYKGAYISTTNSDKLTNNKKRGSIVVRVPPIALNAFIRELRDLPALGDLRTMRITSQEVTKQYTDTESELKAAVAVQDRLIEIIKKGTGEIKDLVAAERELGTWRIRIEKLKGEKIYLENQVALSTLTITLTEKEIQAAAAMVVDAKVLMRVEVGVVKTAREAAEKAVKDLGGRLVKSDEKQHPAGQVEATVHADIPPDKKEEFRQAIEKLGIVSTFEATQTQTAEGGTGKAINPQQRVNDVRFELTLNNIVNIRPKNSVEMSIASNDVPAKYAALRELVDKFSGQIRDGKINEQDKHKATAFLDFNVPKGKKGDIDKLIETFGPVLKKVNTQAGVTEISTDQKFGYVVQLFGIGAIPPREIVRLEIEVQDVDKKASELIELVKASKGQAYKGKSGTNRQGQASTNLVMAVPVATLDVLVHQFKKEGKLLDWEQTPNPSVPDNELATAQISVVLNGRTPIAPSDEGLGSYVNRSLYFAYKVVAWAMSVLIVGVVIVVPIGLLIFVGYVGVRRVWPVESPRPPIKIDKPPTGA
ncbi:MAG: DUF4349 domain-containing protein [Planctomycetes bacterium]|nr:DUF4349 domain-containing protein [Planctomycetota bacterium]